MTDSHIRAAEWTNQVSPPRLTNKINVARTLEAAAAAGLELRFNQRDDLWYWQSIASTVLDWRGSGHATKTDACRSFDQGSIAL